MCAYPSQTYENQCAMEAETVSNCSQCRDPVCLVMHEWISSQDKIHEITIEDCIQSLLDGITTQNLDAFCDDEKENQQPQTRSLTSGPFFEVQSFNIKPTVVSSPSPSHLQSRTFNAVDPASSLPFAFCNTGNIQNITIN